VWYQSPTHEHHLVRALRDDEGHHLAWRNVVARDQAIKAVYDVEPLVEFFSWFEGTKLAKISFTSVRNETDSWAEGTRTGA
jgi:hypothetical protein